MVLLVLLVLLVLSMLSDLSVCVLENVCCAGPSSEVDG